MKPNNSLKRRRPTLWCEFAEDQFTSRSINACNLFDLLTRYQSNWRCRICCPVFVQRSLCDQARVRANGASQFAIPTDGKVIFQTRNARECSRHCIHQNMCRPYTFDTTQCALYDEIVQSYSVDAAQYFIKLSPVSHIKGMDMELQTSTRLSLDNLFFLKNIFMQIYLFDGVFLWVVFYAVLKRYTTYKTAGRIVVGESRRPGIHDLDSNSQRSRWWDGHGSLWCANLSAMETSSAVCIISLMLYV